MVLPASSLFDHFEAAPLESVVVFHDHAFAAGRCKNVAVMARPHRHTQFEVNHVVAGAMTYAYDGCRITIETGKTAMFFGMVPHQVVACAPDTQFVCLYLPGALLMGMHLGETLRQALFGGAFVHGRTSHGTDTALFTQWRDDLLSRDGNLMAIAHDEVGARLRRLEHEGWHDGRGTSKPGTVPAGHAVCADKVAAMIRFIGEHASEPVQASDVARAAQLHPNYAMSVFKAAVGVTINDYLIRNRLDTAQTLLACSDRDIATIAFASGFGSLSRFYQAFGSRFGTSPAAFRRSIRPAGG